MSLGTSAKPVVKVDTSDQPVAPSKLDANIQSFVELIFNKKLMEESVIKIGYDVKKMPLGQLSKETVLKGYQVLHKIQDVIEKKSTESLEALTGQFYTNIPHNFGRQKMSNFVIDDVTKLREKLDLIQNLIDIQVAHELMDKSKDEEAKDEKTESKPTIPNPIDLNFDQLKIKMNTLD